MKIKIEINWLDINLEANRWNSNSFTRYMISNFSERQFSIFGTIIMNLRTALISFNTHRTEDSARDAIYRITSRVPKQAVGHIRKRSRVLSHHYLVKFDWFGFERRVSGASAPLGLLPVGLVLGLVLFAPSTRARMYQLLPLILGHHTPNSGVSHK